ncbi:MAG: 16S rRNA (guanine(966)-N(2))-methyltransferase RsmD [Candidatus Omnitrophota bacterium]
MRIIGGEFRGRKIKHPGSGAVRPTKDRIRESVFNVIMGHVPGTKVLDLFAGSGAYGLEALSRGAEKAVFIEKRKDSSNAIRENIELLGLQGRTKVITYDVFKVLEGLKEDKERFDLVFADPPYSKDMAKKTLIKINHYDILIHSGLLIIEHNIQEQLPDLEGDVSILKRKTYGNISISIYSKK